MSMDDKVRNLRKMFNEALECINKKDAIQASEKMYKVAEGSIKILSEVNKLKEYEEARNEGNWWTKLLEKAARKLRDIYG